MVWTHKGKGRKEEKKGDIKDSSKFGTNKKKGKRKEIGRGQSQVWGRGRGGG